MPTERDSEAGELPRGTVVADRFVVAALVRRGGMGAIYRTHDLQEQSPAAVKLVTCENRSAVERFLRECEILASLSHPSVVRYRASGFSADGRPFLAMQWLEGEDLEMRLLRRGLPLSDSLELIVAICDALTYVHEKGLIHRDIKPSNIFLEHGVPARAKLIDFGVARLLQRAAPITRPGATVGTVGYMSPEQARASDVVDARSDLFSLGCVLFECVAGRPAFCADSELELLGRLFHHAPPAISRLRPQLGTALDEPLAQLLEKDASRRTHSAALLKQMLLGLRTLSGEAPRPPILGLATEDERRVISLVFARAVDAVQTRITDSGAHQDIDVSELGRRFAGTPVIHSGATIALSYAVGETACDRARQAARCAIALTKSRPDLRICVVSGKASSLESAPSALFERASRMVCDERPGRHSTIVVDELTAGLLKHHFAIVATESHLELRCEDHETLVRDRLLLGKPSACVGRDAEMALLKAALSECFGSRAPWVGLVVAASGIGKSRIAHELAEHARVQYAATVAVVRGDPSRDRSPMYLARQLLCSQACIQQAQPRADETLRTYLGTLLDGEQLEHAHAFLCELLEIRSGCPDARLQSARQAPEIMREQTLRAYAAWFRALVHTRPLVLVLDDLHWGDLPSTSCLERAIRECSDLALFTIGLARPEIKSRIPNLWSGLRVQELRLNPLSARAAQALILGAVRTDIEEPMLNRLVQLADGNAFYLEELARHVAERRNGLPATVIAMAQSRLEALEQKARRILRCASILGETFWSGAVVDISGEIGDISPWLEYLEQEEVIARRRPARFAGEQEFSFRHALLREAAYAMNDDDVRRAAHRRAGEWLETHDERDALAIAEQYELGGLSEAALPWVTRASIAALEGGDFEHATAMSVRGERLGARGEELGQLLLTRGYSAAWKSNPDLAAVQAAVALLPENSAQWWLAVALAIFGCATRGENAAAVPYIELALATRPRAPLGPAHGQALQALAAGMALMGRAQQLWPLIDVLLEDGRTADHGFMAWVYLAWCQLATTCPRDAQWKLERAWNLGRESVAMLRDAGSAYGEAIALYYFGTAARVLGIYEEAEQALSHSAAVASRTGNRLIEQYANLFVSHVLVRQGRVLEGRSRLQPLAASHDPNVAQAATALTADSHFFTGELERAVELALLALNGPAAPYRRIAGSVLARCYAALGRPAEAIATADSALAVQVAANPEFEADLLATKAEAHRLLGQAEMARAVIATARSFVAGIADAIETASLRDNFLARVGPVARVMALEA